MSPVVAWMLWLATINLGAAKALTDLVDEIEGDED
jgi:hypothetical protein